MSFLVETEESATLEAALQFIDGFETKDKPTNAQPITGKSLKKRASQKRARRLPIKEELEQLRRLVPELEGALAYVKGSRGLRMSSQRSVWMEVLSEEYRRRKQAEATNHQLKLMLANLVDSMRTSRDSILDPIAKEDLALLYEPQPTRALSRHAMEDSLVVGLLADRLQTLKLDMDSVIQRAGLVDANSRFSRKLHQVDSKLGALVESSCCLPMTGSVELAAEQFWSRFYQRLRAHSGISVSEVNGQRKRYTHEFDQSKFKLTVRMSARRHVEADRVVIMWSSVVSMPSKGVRFNLDHMVVVKPAGNSLMAGSLLQAWFRVHAERFESPEMVSNDGVGVEPLSGHVMDSMSNDLTTYLTSFKSALSGSS